MYVVIWVMWLSKNSLPELYAKDVFAGVFFSIYGLNDFVFMVFFAWVFLSRRADRQGVIQFLGRHQPEQTSFITPQTESNILDPDH